MIFGSRFRNTFVAIVSAFISGAMLSPASADAVSVGGLGGATGHVGVGSQLEQGAFTAPPKAFVDFCDRYAAQCVRTGSAETMAFDKERWSQLVRINRSVNRAIRPSADAADIDNWRLGVSKGACSDFAIEKRKLLIDLGWSSAALALTVVYTSSGQAHLVLTARTDRGDYVLDSLRSEILPVNTVGYEFVMWQSSIHPRLWVNVAGSANSDTSQTRIDSTSQDPNHAPLNPRSE